MERATISPSLSQNYLVCPSPRAFTTRLHSFSTTRNLSPSSCSSSIKLQHSSSNGGTSLTRCNAVLSNSSSRFVVFKIILGYPYLNLMMRLWGFITLLNIYSAEVADIDWDNIGFGLKPTDYMYVMKCNLDGEFSKGELQLFGNIEVSPSAGVLNYGQGLFEGMKAYRKQDGKNILLFRPEENANRMRSGAERMCMPAPTIDQFVEAVKATVLANKRWVPPAGKGSLYIRPLLMGTGAVLGLAPAPEYTFLVYVSPVGNYFKEGVAPINLIVESEFHRATPGGTGGVKTIGNYAAVLKAQSIAKSKGYSDVLYLDCVHKRYLEEVSSCNIFIVKDNVISTPEIKGTILPGITRKSIIDVARTQGFKVEERNVTVDELLEADEVFCTGTAVVVSPVGSITHKCKRVSYGEGSFGPVSEKLYTVLTSLQMGLSEDNMNWTLNLS
ncbi:hypothetical protein DY000_02055661 [Brassica cretica]|uniref:Branched-chain-amino-acid aminotransferase n=1 Tax=Brassica cretica TaxID=69181 RepID=A0ABQ7AGG8_BRACR|nr:hypothetical protein DY000_02055661 [Brassica cretica]